MRNLIRPLALAAILLAVPAFTAHAAKRQTDSDKDPRLAGSYTFERGGWTYVHLEGSPAQIGFQHGYILGPQIADALNVFKVEDEHDTKRDWQFFRDAAKNMFWPHIDAEYRAEMQGIADGAQARGVKIFGGTLTPFENETFLPGAWNPAREAVRQEVNAWIRSGGAFDAVIDFDAGVRDPEHPTAMLPIWDCGDHLHQSDAGYNHMGDIIDLGLFE